MRELRSNEKFDKQSKALRAFVFAYFIEKECVDNHNDYDDDLVHDIIKTVV